MAKKTTIIVKQKTYDKMLQLAKELAAEFKKFEKDLAKAEVLAANKGDHIRFNDPYFKELERLEKLNEKLYNVLRKGGFSY